MDNELDKIDILRSRFKIGYEDARSVLNEASGDVVTALATLEKRKGGRTDLLAIAAEMTDEVQKLISGNPIRKLRVKFGDRLITETPVAMTALAALAVGLAAVLITRLVIEVEKGEEEAAR